MLGQAESHEWTLLSPPRSTTAVAVRFASTRTQFHRVTLGASGRTIPLEPRGSTLFRALVSEDWEDGERVRLLVRYQGDMPFLSTVWWDAPGEKLSGGVAVPGWYEGEETLVSTTTVPYEDIIEYRPGTGESEEEVPHDELFRRRMHATEDFIRAQRFFLRLDMETNLALAPDRWVQTVQGLIRRLEHRIEVRSMLGKRDRVPLFRRLSPTSPFDRRSLSRLREVSLRLRQLILSSLEIGGTAELVDWSFELFVTDRLAVQHRCFETQKQLQSHGAPDGIGFYQLVEFALYAIENDVDADFWSRHASTLVKAAHILLEHAVNSVPNPAARIRGESFQFQPGRYFPRARLEDYRRDYRVAGELEPEARMAWLVDRFTSVVASSREDLEGRVVEGSTRALLQRAKVELHRALIEKRMAQAEMPRGPGPAEPRAAVRAEVLAELERFRRLLERRGLEDALLRLLLGAWGAQDVERLPREDRLEVIGDLEKIAVELSRAEPRRARLRRLLDRLRVTVPDTAASLSSSKSVAAKLDR